MVQTKTVVAMVALYVNGYVLHMLSMSLVVCMVYAKHNVSLPVT